MEEVIETLLPELLSGPPVALFGHSLGGLIAFELAAALHRRGHAPRHLFVSAARPPHVRDPYQLHGLNESALVRALRERGGVSEELLAHAELRDLVLPLLRADLTIAERHLRAQPLTLPVPITVLAAPADTVIPWHVTDAWSQYTCASFERCTFVGSHFFVREDPELVWRCVLARLEGLSMPFDDTRAEFRSDV
jgi:surfactin synthase thioesterase subunit